MDFDIHAVTQAVTDTLISRMASLGMTDAEYEENAGILHDFNKIAADMLAGEAGLEMPGSTESIPLDEHLITQALNLFSEGICFAMVKCLEMGITGDTKKTILQNMALEVYNQAKQVVACTYGQEH